MQHTSGQIGEALKRTRRATRKKSNRHGPQMNKKCNKAGGPIGVALRGTGGAARKEGQIGRTLKRAEGATQKNELGKAF